MEKAVGILWRVMLAVLFVGVTSLLLMLLPVNEQRLNQFSAERLHQALTDASDAKSLGSLSCSVVVMSEKLVPVAESFEKLGAFGSGAKSQKSCRIAISEEGWQLKAELAGEHISTSIIDVALIQWSSLLPAILAITLAVLTRKLILSLLIGILFGAAILGVDGSSAGAMTGMTLGTFQILYSVMVDDFHFWIFLFTFSLIGMVNVSIVSGGMTGLANLFGRLAKTARSTQLATAALGMAIFFDDYSNTIVVGGCMRPLSDKAKISREKLAYIVDSTAAPIAGLALISTWIGYEVGLIGDAMTDLGITSSPYAMFISTIPYRFYCILTIVFVLINIASKREFGSMYTAQKRAFDSGEVLRVGSNPLTGKGVAKSIGREKAVSALLPVLSVIFLVLAGMALNGAKIVGPGFFNLTELGSFQFAKLFSLQDNYLISCMDGAWVLAMASLFGSFLAVLLGLTIGKTPLLKLLMAWLSAGRMLLLAFSVMILAWAMGNLNNDLGTGAFLVSSLAENISPLILPVLVFILAACISFATGSSWGTMAILLPAVVPLAHYIGSGSLMIITIGAVLDGSIFGDHCSPLSDTTIMSSIAASCDHLDHVKTQLPYALLVGFGAIVFGYLLASTINPLLSYLLAAIMFALVFRFVGKVVE